MRLLLALLLCLPIVAQAMAIYTEDWPPVSFTNQAGQADGMAVEVVRELQKRLGRKEPIQVLPWARAYQILLSTPDVMLFSVGRNAEREKRMTLLGPIAISSTDLFALAGNAETLRQQPASWPQKLTAAYRGSIFETAARDAGLQVYRTDSPSHSARMLLAGRVQLWSEGNLVMGGVLRELGIAADKVEKVATLQSLSLYLAFSAGTTRSQIRLWEDALRDMKKDGSFQRIHQRWLPGLPAPMLTEVIGIAANPEGVSEAGR